VNTVSTIALQEVRLPAELMVSVAAMKIGNFNIWLQLACQQTPPCIEAKYPIVLAEGVSMS